MRSTPWTCSIPTITHYELRDDRGQVLGRTDSRGEAVRMLQAVVITSPGREDDVWLVSVAADGREIGREDVFDVEVETLL